MMTGYDDKNQQNENFYLNLTHAGMEAERLAGQELPPPETVTETPAQTADSSYPLEAAAEELAPAASFTPPPASTPVEQGGETASYAPAGPAPQPEISPLQEQLAASVEAVMAEEFSAAEPEALPPQNPPTATTVDQPAPYMPLSFDADWGDAPILPLQDKPIQPRGTLPWDAPSPLAGPPPQWAREEKSAPAAAPAAYTTPVSGPESTQNVAQPEYSAPQPEIPATARPDYQNNTATPTDNVHLSVPSQREEKKEKKRPTITVTRRAAVAVVLLCLLLSSVLGLGGGWLASAMNDDQAAIVADNGESEDEDAATNNRTDVTPVATPSGQGLTYTQVAALAADSVVEIVVQTTSYDRWFGVMTQEGAGSGVIISEDGYIVTNNHVVEGANTIGITLRNGTVHTAQIVATDEKTDVAVIKVEATGLTPATLGDSDALQVGDPATVIGNPLGQLGGSVTCGAISALDREIDLGSGNQSKVMNLLQTDAAINQGNSGGGLFNQYGELVGIVVAKSGGISVEGLGFAIPINDVKEVINDLIDYGYARRVQLGIAMVPLLTEQDMLSYRVDTPGVYVVRVEENSNAARAGLKVGDRLVSLNGTAIEGTSDVTRVVNSCNFGDTMTIVFDRQGTEQTVQVVMQENLPEGSNPI